MSELTYGTIESAIGLGDLLFGGVLPNLTDRNLMSAMRSTFSVVSQELAGLANASLSISAANTPRIQAANAIVRARNLAIGQMLSTIAQVKPLKLSGHSVARVHTYKTEGIPQDVPAKPSLFRVRQAMATVNQATMTVARAAEFNVVGHSVLRINESLARIDTLISEGRIAEIEQVAAEVKGYSHELERNTEAEQVARRRQAVLANQSLAKIAALWEGLHTGAIGLWIRNNNPSEDYFKRRIQEARHMYVVGQFADVPDICGLLETEMTVLLEEARTKVAREQRNILADSVSEVLHGLGYSTSKMTDGDEALIEGHRSGRRMLTVSLDDAGRMKIDSAKDRAFVGAACSVAVNEFLKRFTEVTKAKIDIEDRAFLGNGDRPTGSAAFSGNRRRITTANLVADVQRHSTTTTVPPHRAASAWALLTR